MIQAHDSKRSEKVNEHAIVSIPNISTKPGTVMVKVLDAIVTMVTVKGSWWLIDDACGAKFQFGQETAFVKNRIVGTSFSTGRNFLDELDS